MQKKYLMVMMIAALMLAGGEAFGDFIAEDYVTGQSFITSMAFAPNGAFMFIEKTSGEVKIVQGQNSVRPQPFYQFNVNSQGERGGLGLTFHPQYPDSPYVYAYVTIGQQSVTNVVIRLVDSLGFGTNPDTIFRAPVTSGASIHNGGNIHFGPDGKLYITIGDNAVSQWAQDTCVVQGKILRINYDGTIPSDNPIACAPVYAYGLRNSYDFSFHPVTGALYASENGPTANDEVNLILPGRNYGWPVVQCTSNDDQYVDALICWSPTIAPTGILMVHNSLIPEINGRLLMADWNRGQVHSFLLNAAGDSILSDDIVHTVSAGLVDLEQGIDGMIYISTGNGSIVRLRPISIPHAPSIDFYLPSQQNIEMITGDIDFAISASDPDNDPLAFGWFLNGGNAGNDSMVTISFTNPGTYEVLAVASDGQLADSIGWNIIVHTSGGNPPLPFSLAKPLNNEKIVTLNTNFSWCHADDWDFNAVVEYRLELDADSLFNGGQQTLDTNSDTLFSIATNVLEGWGSAVFYRVLAIDNDSLVTIGGLPLPEIRRFSFIPPGDANGNGITNGLDVVFLVNFLKGLGPSPEPLLAGDVNSSCSTNGLDVTYMVNFFKGGPGITRPNCIQ